MISLEREQQIVELVVSHRHENELQVLKFHCLVLKPLEHIFLLLLEGLRHLLLRVSVADVRDLLQEFHVWRVFGRGLSALFDNNFDWAASHLISEILGERLLFTFLKCVLLIVIKPLIVSWIVCGVPRTEEIREVVVILGAFFFPEAVFELL